MVLPLGTKVSEQHLENNTLLDSPLLKNRNRKKNSSLLMEGYGVYPQISAVLPGKDVEIVSCAIKK